MSTTTKQPVLLGASPELRTFIDRVIVPALLERWLREQAERSTPEAA